MRMLDLIPGDIMRNPIAPDGDPEWGVFIGHIDPSPLYPNHFTMFIWRLSNDSYSFDSLSPIMHIYPNEVLALSAEERKANLQWAVGMYKAKKPNVG